jgi:hypothetical protein
VFPYLSPGMTIKAPSCTRLTLRVRIGRGRRLRLENGINPLKHFLKKGNTFLGFILFIHFLHGLCRYKPDMDIDEAIHTAILTLKEGFEGAISENNIEIGIVGADHKFKMLTPREIKDYLEEVE